MAASLHVGIAIVQEVFSAVRSLMRDGEGFILLLTDGTGNLAPISKISEQIKRGDTDQHVPIVLVGNKVRSYENIHTR